MEYNFATVNMERVLSETKAGKRIIDDIRSREEPKKQEYQKLIKEIVDLRNQYQTKANKNKPEETLELRQKIEQKELIALRFQESTLKELENYRLQTMAEFEKKVFPVIDKMASEKKLTFLFPYPQRWIIFADRQIDLTDEIIKLIDKEVKPFSVKPSTPGMDPSGKMGNVFSHRPKGGGGIKV